MYIVRRLTNFERIVAFLVMLLKTATTFLKALNILCIVNQLVCFSLQLLDIPAKNDCFSQHLINKEYVCILNWVSSDI